MDRLAKNLLDTLEEGQLKIGYRRESVRLYYPLASLCALLGETMSRERMREALVRFSQAHRETFGDIAVSNRGDRFCLEIPEQGTAYAHAHTDPDGFLAQFLAAVSRPGATLDEVIAVFRRHSDHVAVRRLSGGEFDALVCFEDGVPDDYRYCIACEPGHLSYHRFTPEDYDAFGF